MISGEIDSIINKNIFSKKVVSPNAYQIIAPTLFKFTFTLILFAPVSKTKIDMIPSMIQAQVNVIFVRNLII